MTSDMPRLNDRPNHAVQWTAEDFAEHRLVTLVNRLPATLLYQRPHNRVVVVQYYRLFFFDGAEHIERVHEFEAVDDDAAIKIAEAWREGRKMELWQRDRRIKRWVGQA